MKQSTTLVKAFPKVRSFAWSTLIAVVFFVTFGPRSHETAQTRRPPPVITTLTDVIHAMRFSPDGRILAIARGSRDENRVELWDTESGKLLRTIRGFDGPVWSVSFAPDVKTLLTGSGGSHPTRIGGKPNARDGAWFTELKWWDPQTGELRRRLELPGERVANLGVLHSPNGQLLATIESRMFMNMIANGVGIQDPESVPSRPLSVRAGQQADLKLRDAESGEVKLKLKDNFTIFATIFGTFDPELFYMLASSARIPPLAFSSDGQLVAAWSSSEARLWSTVTGKEELLLKKFKGRLGGFAFSPDGHSAAGAITKISVKNNQANFQSEIQLWEVASGAALQAVPIDTQTVSSLTFARNGQQLLVGGLHARMAIHTPVWKWLI